MANGANSCAVGIAEPMCISEPCARSQASGVKQIEPTEKKGAAYHQTSPMSFEPQIQSMIDRETAAWNAQDAEALVDLFHPDTVWPWPPDANSHDPSTWVMPFGRFNKSRWQTSWQALFDSHELVRNQRITVKIEVSEQLDGAFAVVDVDTLWRHRRTAATEH